MLILKSPLSEGLQKAHPKKWCTEAPEECEPNVHGSILQASKSYKPIQGKVT
jgi:hypothetical protein